MMKKFIRRKICPNGSQRNKFGKYVRNKRRFRSFTGEESEREFPLFPNDTNFPDFFRAYPCEDRLVCKMII